MIRNPIFGRCWVLLRKGRAALKAMGHHVMLETGGKVLTVTHRRRRSVWGSQCEKVDFQQKTIWGIERLAFSEEEMQTESGAHPSPIEDALEKERRYDWLGASKAYQMALGAVPATELEIRCDMLERRAYALYKSSLQSETVDEFRQTAETATDAYRKAQSECIAVDSPQGRARASRCDAMISFLGFLGAADADERRKTTLESWNHAKESLDAFESLGDAHEFCRTFYDTSLAAVYYSNLVPDFETRKKVWVEATSRGEKAVTYAHDHEPEDMNVKILVLVACFLNRASYSHLCDEPVERCREKTLDLWRRAESISKTKVLASLPYAYITGDAPVDPDREASNELPMYREALELVRDSKDRLITGHALAGISFFAQWAGYDHADKEKEDVMLAESLETALEARGEFLKIGFVAETGHNIWVMSPHAEMYQCRAYNERDLEKKREFVEKGLRASSEYVKLAKESGYSWQNGTSEALQGVLLSILATTETDVATKRAHLLKAVDFLRKGMEIMSRWDSKTSLNLAVWSYPLAEVQVELATTTADRESAARILREAIAVQEKSHQAFEEGAKAMYLMQESGTLCTLGTGLSQIGHRYRDLFEIEKDQSVLRNALKCFERAYGFFSRGGWPSRAAESIWEAARIHDLLGGHAKAAEKFLLASKAFRASEERIPRLKDLFSEQATYLEAWADFEKAKYHHSRQDYGQARSHFEKAAELHDALEKWRFLASNYRAWALTDQAESLSREDRRQDAAKAFEEAAALFAESSAELDGTSKSIEDADEKRMISRLLRSSGPRREYCLARALVEKARQMDVEGMSSSSSEMYREAADELERLSNEAPTEQDRADIKVLAILSRAWQKMNQAEAEVSPEPYSEAARLFEEVKELCTDDKAKALSLGHSRFCRALEAGARFADTREASQHAIAVKNLESASAFYVKAGSDRCSEYARASKLLFDAYAYLAEAGQEKEQEKAAKAYARAEKVLEAASVSYDRAGQPGKRDQVLKLFARVQRERELAVSLMEVFEAPVGASATSAFSVPKPSQEEAVGLDRFVHADVRATLILPRKDVKVGDDMGVEIEMVNAGRASAQLTKVENIIPPGFEILAKPEYCRIEDSYIAMKGKRLDPLKTEEISLVLKPMVKGKFLLKPRILYLDDQGSYKMRELEGCEVTVKELGVAGWLKGPERRE